MKFVVEVEDFYLEDEELESSLKDFVSKKVIEAIYKRIEVKVNDTITRTVQAQVQVQLIPKVNKLFEEFIANGKINKDSYGREQITIEQYIKAVFENTNNWGYPQKQIADLATQFGKELKARYDLMFATQIVQKIDKEGLLKEGVAKLLLADNQAAS